jgi:4-amino-4-deoxy-L-arabinose transferase-like glycosyltransferase
MKSKFISGAPLAWPSIISQLDSVTFHVDYPLMQSAFIAKYWIILGKESTWIPILSAFVFTFCSIGLLSSSVSLFTTKTKGLFAGLALLATPFFITLGDSQYADVTVGFFFLSTIVFLTFADKEKENKRNYFLAAGISASMAAWSKNEGILFIVCLIFTRILSGINRPKDVLSELKFLLAGTIPVLILLVYYKIMIAPPNDLIQGAGEESIINKIMNIERYELIGYWFIKKAGSFGEWIINPWWFFLIAALMFGVNNRNKTSYGMLLILFMLIGYFYSYVISYIELNFHLSTSLHRLFLQLFPSFLFCYFLSIKELEKN